MKNKKCGACGKFVDSEIMHTEHSALLGEAFWACPECKTIFRKEEQKMAKIKATVNITLSDEAKAKLDEFRKLLEKASETIASWPDWKQRGILGGSVEVATEIFSGGSECLNKRTRQLWCVIEELPEEDPVSIDWKIVASQIGPHDTWKIVTTANLADLTKEEPQVYIPLEWARYIEHVPSNIEWDFTHCRVGDVEETKIIGRHVVDTSDEVEHLKQKLKTAQLKIRRQAAHITAQDTKIVKLKEFREYAKKANRGLMQDILAKGYKIANLEAKNKELHRQRDEGLADYITQATKRFFDGI